MRDELLRSWSIGDGDLLTLERVRLRDAANERHLGNGCDRNVIVRPRVERRASSERDATQKRDRDLHCPQPTKSPTIG